MSRKVFLYARVSTTDQQKGLESQVQALKKYCALNKITDYELFADEGVSGTKSSRPSLDRMMEAIRKGEASCLVVYSFSRFARSVTHMLQDLEELKKTSTNFVSLTERVDTESPIGKAIFVIISAIAALERDLIAERVKNGLKNAREKGKLLGRAKKRDSILIRKLLDAGLSYRNVAKIAKCSHGSVHAEVVQYKRDKALKKSLAESAVKENEITEALITTTITELENKVESSKMAFPQFA
jgi:DNA invertase Pin-like site-specific DNA recombinase